MGVRDQFGTVGADDAAAAKAGLRQRLRSQRRRRTDEQRTRDASGLCEVALGAEPLRSAEQVALYCSGPTEPGTGPLRERLRARGVRVLVPVVRGLDLDWAVDDGPLIVGYRGLLEPTGRRLGPAALAACDVALVPALAADLTGARLGQGGGFYDRALAAHRPAGPVLAVVHPDELLASGEIPVGPHDIPVDAVATAAGWRWADSAR